MNTDPRFTIERYPAKKVAVIEFKPWEQGYDNLKAIIRNYDNRHWEAIFFDGEERIPELPLKGKSMNDVIENAIIHAESFHWIPKESEVKESFEKKLGKLFENSLQHQAEKVMKSYIENVSDNFSWEDVQDEAKRMGIKITYKEAVESYLKIVNELANELDKKSDESARASQEYQSFATGRFKDFAGGDPESRKNYEHHISNSQHYSTRADKLREYAKSLKDSYNNEF